LVNIKQYVLKSVNSYLHWFLPLKSVLRWRQFNSF